MKTILVPTDFSDSGRNAAIYAAEFAKQIQGRLILYHAYTVPIVVNTDMPTAMMIDPKIIDEENKILLQKEVDYISSNFNIPITSKTNEGFAVDEIIDLEKKEKPDLIIMGMRENGAISELLIGSIATDVIRQSLTPVMIVPFDAKFKPFKKMVFAADYSLETDTHLFDPIKKFTKLFNSKLFILNIVKQIELIGVEKEVSRMRIQNYFEDLEHTHYYLKDENVVHGLNEFIDQYDIDIITMLPHKHNLFSRIFRESNTKKMAFHTHIPLLTLPSRTF